MTEQTACRRCRTQKLRCDRQQPHCARCLRVNAECTYPLPPDRKLIAARRRAPKKDPSPVSTSGITAIDQRLLIDLYFKLVFKSTLSYHRPSFDISLQQGTLSQHTLLSVYALALNFLDPETTHNLSYRQQLQHLGCLRSLAEQYAMVAGKEVLRDIDEPSTERIQTCQNLAYFWFSRGDSHRNTLFSGIAYKASRTQLIEQSSSSLLEGELTRRIFWGSYIQACVNADDIGSASDTLTLDTRLPISNVSYHSTMQETSITMAEMLDSTTSKTGLGVWPYCLSILAIWTMIRNHIASRRRTATNQILIDALLLQQNLDRWSANLPEHFAYSRRNLFTMIQTGEQQVYTTTHAMNYYCHLALNSSLVPQFGETAPKDLSVDAIRISIEASIRNAQALTELASDVVTLECDFTQLPPYLAYCMYVAGSIHLTMINSEALGENARKQLSLALAVLQGMRPFWAIIQQLWTRLLDKCEKQVEKGTMSADVIPDDMTQPISQFSLSKSKREDSLVDAEAVPTKVSPKEFEGVDQQLLELSQAEPFDFGELANTYGDDWWQFDVPSFQPIADITDFV